MNTNELVISSSSEYEPLDKQESPVEMITRICNETPTLSTLSKNEVKEALDKNEFHFLQLNGETIAFFRLTDYENSGQIFTDLSSVYVFPEYRGNCTIQNKNVSKIIFESAIGLASKKEGNILFLETVHKKIKKLAREFGFIDAMVDDMPKPLQKKLLNLVYVLNLKSYAKHPSQIIDYFKKGDAKDYTVFCKVLPAVVESSK